MRKKKVLNITALCFFMTCIMVVAVSPLRAKTVRKLYVTGYKFYEKDSTGKWNLTMYGYDLFNKKGQHIGDQTYVYNKQGKKTDYARTIFKVDKKGRAKTEKEYKYNKLKSISINTYKGETTITKNYNEKNKYTGKSIFIKNSSKKSVFVGLV